MTDLMGGGKELMVSPLPTRKVRNQVDSKMESEPLYL